MYNKGRITPLIIVQFYLKNKASLRKTAQIYGIHYQTIFKWVKIYKTEGEGKLLSNYRRPWNRASKKLEKKVMLLKENRPSLTLKEAKEILEKERIKISIKGIWGIWRRYGLTKKPKDNPYSPFGPETKEAKDAIDRARNYLSLGKIENAAFILNKLPSLPENPILTEIPENFLSLKRRLERLYLFLGKIPFPEYARKAKKLQNDFEKKKFYYSALVAGLHHLVALQWMRTPEEELCLIKKLKGYISKLRDPGIKFTLLAAQARTWATLLDGEKTRELLKKCKRIMQHWRNPYFLTVIGSIYTFLQDFKSALPLFMKAIEYVSVDKERGTLADAIATCLAEMGRYTDSSEFLKEAEKRMKGIRPLYLIIYSFIAFGEGKLSRIFSSVEESLQRSESGALRNYIHSSSLILSSVYAALGRKEEAISLLKKYIPLLKKFKMVRDALVRKILIQKKISPDAKHISNASFPIFKLLFLLQIARESLKFSDYSRALKYADKKGLFGLFHRIIVFFPEIIAVLLEKGKPTGLPKPILRLPVFNKEVPVYDVKFLGNIAVYKNQKYLKTKLRPKDTAFLIQLALKAGEPGKSILLDKIYYNFWRNSKNPPRNLSHLLVRIKKALKIPSHLLEVSYKKDYPVLINRGIHFITDYDEYQQSLAQAKALLRAGEWGFAKREFLRAFKLFRGEPFRKMYDDWSDDKRLEILFGYEKEVKVFADELKKRGRTEEARKLLKKAEKIVPEIDMRE